MDTIAFLMVCKSAVSAGARRGGCYYLHVEAMFHMNIGGVSVMTPRPEKPQGTKITLTRERIRIFKLFFCFFLRTIIGPYFLNNGHSSLNRHIYKIDVKNKFINFLTKIV